MELNISGTGLGQPQTSTGGCVCQHCGQWVDVGMFHFCSIVPSVSIGGRIYPNCGDWIANSEIHVCDTWTNSPDYKIATALERIAATLEKIADKMP